jgi:hypothetical protein
LKTLLAASVSVIFIACCAQAQQAQQGAQQPASQPDAQQPSAPPTSGTSSSSSSSAPAAPSERFISGGLTASFLGLSLIPKRTSTDDNSTAIQTQYQTTGASSRFGYGLTLQVHVKGHFYVDLSGIVQRIGYQETTTVATTVIAVLNGSTYPSTTATSTHEDTRARLIDIPVLVRYYGNGKRPA